MKTPAECFPSQVLRHFCGVYAFVALVFIVGLWNLSSSLRVFAPCHQTIDVGTRYGLTTSARSAESGMKNFNLEDRVSGGKNEELARSDHDQSKSCRNNGVDLTVVVLAKDELEQLKLVVGPVLHADYGGDSVDVVIHICDSGTQHNPEILIKSVRWIHTEKGGGVCSARVAETHMNCDEAWRTAWIPFHDEARAVIFTGHVNLDHRWYARLKMLHMEYSDRDNIAGFCLHWKSSVFKMSESANFFLHRRFDCNGYAPVARKWRDFVEWIELRVEKFGNLSLSDDELNFDGGSEGKENDISLIYTYYLNRAHHDMSVLYANSMATSRPWENGENVLGKNLPKYDLNGDLVSKQQTLVMSGAVGYSYKEFKDFVASLRNVYDGEVHLLVREEELTREIQDFLEKKKVNLSFTSLEGDTQSGSAGWGHFNRERFRWYASICTTHYWLCLAIDFRDSKFQLHPFSGLSMQTETKLFLYQHHLIVDNWHLEQLQRCNMSETYAPLLAGKLIVNAGGIIGDAYAFAELAQLMNTYTCNDQVTLNFAYYAGLFNVSVKAHFQGFGNINNVGFGANNFFNQHKQFLSNDCFIAPVIHQYHSVPLPEKL